MEQVISTIMFNGQFWIILIEKISRTGSISIGKYTFGAEPTFGDITDFYDCKFQFLKFYPSDSLYRVKKKYSKKELDRMENKSLSIFKESQKKYLEERKGCLKQREIQEQQEKYKQKCEKKKLKKKGK